MTKKNLILALVCVLLLSTTFTIKASSVTTSDLEETAENFNEAIEKLILMDTLTGEQRKQNKVSAISALDAINNLSVNQEFKDLANASIDSIQNFHDTDKGANHYEILALIKELAQSILNTGYDHLTFTDKGDFLVSYDMMDSHISDITWPGSHNSYANDEDAERNFGSNYQNQGLSLSQQLDSGIRWLDMDVGPGDALGAPGVPAYFVHNSGTGGRVRFDTGLNAIKEFAMANPDIVIIFEMADISNMDKGYAYGKLREAFYSSGLSEYVYNMRPNASKQNNASDIFTDASSINPKLMDMVGTGKNVLFVPHQQWYAKDRAYFQEIHGSGNSRQDYEATKIEERSQLTAIWDPNNLSGQSTDPLRFMSLELDPDDGSLAGNRFFAARNNDGRRLYQIAKWYEDRMPDNKHINYFKIDFYKDSLIRGNTREASYNSVIHASNTLNSERFNTDITPYQKVELYPDFRGVDILRLDSQLMSEVNTVTGNARNHQLEKSEWSQNDGRIKAGGRRRHKQGSTRLNWWCLPEFAMDNDFSTVWAADGTNSIEFNFVNRRNFRYIYIAWEYNMATPGFKIMGSNGGGQWDTLKTVTKVKETNSLFQKVDLGSIKNYQYIKIQTTDVDNEARTGISEIFIYE